MKKPNFFKNDFIKLWGGVIFIILLLNFWGAKSPIIPIMEAQSNKLQNVIGKVTYHSELIIDPKQIDLLVIDLIENSNMDLDLILPIFKPEWLELIKSAHNRGVKIRIITKNIYRNIIDDLTNKGIIVKYDNNINSGIIYVDNRIGANIILLKSSVLSTVFMDVDNVSKFKIIIDELFLKSNKIF